jgi:hypothetical protein
MYERIPILSHTVSAISDLVPNTSACSGAVDEALSETRQALLRVVESKVIDQDGLKLAEEANDKRRFEVTDCPLEIPKANSFHLVSTGPARPVARQISRGHSCNDEFALY